MNGVKPPSHLKLATRAWFAEVHAAWEMEEHNTRLFTLACVSWDVAEKARAAIRKHGLTYDDRFGVPHPRPEVAILRDAMTSFARLLRETGLDAAAIGTPRPFALPANNGRKSGTAS